MSTRRLAAPWGLLGMLALVLGVERYVARHDLMFTTLQVSAWKQSGGHVAEAARCAWLGLGDSLVKHGLVPPVLEARAGRSAYNLAVPGGMFPGHYFLLRRVLGPGSGSRPSAVLVDGEMLCEDPFASPRVWPEIATLPECADLARAGGDAAFLGRMAVAKVLPSYRTRPEVRLAVMAAFAGKGRDEPFVLPTIWRNWNKNGGAQVLPPRDDPPGTDPRAEELARVDYRPAPWACHPVNAGYVTRLLDLAAGHGVPVFWLLPPYHPEVQARRERFGWDAAYMTYLRDLQRRHPNLTVIDGRHAGYPPEVLADMTHLSRTGAIAFSDAVAGLLRDRLAPGAPASAPRWVEVPRYDRASAEALASASGVEDLNESGRELQRTMNEVRQKRRERRLAQGRTPGGERRSR